MDKRIVALAATWLLAGSAWGAAAQNIPWVRNGSAQPGPTGNTIITQETAMQAGSTWNPCSFNISNTNFNICTEQFFGDSYCGADGMAFVLQTGGTTQLGANSGEHGYSGIGNSLAIALDTYTNPAAPYYDPAYHTYNLNRNGGTAFEGPSSCAGQFGSNWATGSCRSQASGTNAIISDNAWHTVCYTWDYNTRTLGFSFDGMARGSWTLPSDYVTSAFGGNPTVYYGFTASTGGALNYQEVRQTSGNLPTNCQPSPTPNANTFPATTLDTCGATPVPTFTPPGPTPTPTITPTPYPPGCGPPTMNSAANVANGCYNASNTYAFTAPVAANSLMVIHVETGNGTAPSSISYAGAGATLVRSDNGGWGNAQLATFYVKQPASGSNSLIINMPGAACSWNVAVVVYSNVDQATPIGGTAFAANSGCPSTWSNTVTVANPASILDDFMAIDNLPASTSLGAGQTSFGYATGCCNNIYGSWKPVVATGATSMTYTPSQCKNFASQLIEVRGYASCSTPTRTRTPTQTFTRTSTPTFTYTLTYSATPTNTFVPSPTLTATRTATQTFTRTATQTVTLTVTLTPTPTVTYTITLTATPTFTRTITLTATPTFTRTITLTATPSVTITVTPSPTRTVTITVTPTATPTITLTRTPTFTPTATPSSTPTYTLTLSPTLTPTRTITLTATPTTQNTATFTSTVTFTPSITPTRTPTFTPTATPTPTRTYTVTATPSQTLSATPTATRTSSPTVTITFLDTFTNSPTITLTRTPTFTPTATPTATRTYTVTVTPSPTPSSTLTPTRTSSPTVTITFLDTFTHSPTITLTRTPTFTPTATPTATRTYTVTATPTATLTFSPTLSSTLTPTRTASPTVTITFLDTYTNSPTITVTRTPTYTPTSTPTATRTYTLTATPSATPTFLDTMTFTPTATPSRTPTSTYTATSTATPTSTRTATHTASPTVTITFLDTYTNSPTITLTGTPTSTPSISPTGTPSRTPSATPTSTPTATPSFTESPIASPTNSPTVSPTPTVTRTATPSATPSATRTDSPTATATPTATPTSTVSPINTATHTPTATPTFTATPTATPTLTVSPVNTATHTPTATRSITPSATRTASTTATLSASPTATRTVTSTFTATRTATLTVTQTISFTNSPTRTDSPTTSPTPVPEPFHISLSIYNEAGELVRVVFEGSASTAGPHLTVVSTVLADGSTQVTLGGFTSTQGNTVVWNASNDNAQSISNGVYYAKLSVVDAFGSQQSYSEPFTVLSTSDEATVEIFNSAGERVRTMSLPASLLPVDMRALEESFVGGLDPSGAPIGGLRLQLKDNNGEQPLLWDGLNDQGQLLASGSYTVSLTRTQAGGARVVKTLSVVMLASADEALQLSLASAQAAPNPVRGAGVPVRIFYDVPPRGTANCRLYDLAGQLIAQGADLNGSGLVELNGSFAGGIFVVEFRIQDGAAILGRRALKVAVIR